MRDDPRIIGAEGDSADEAALHQALARSLHDPAAAAPALAALAALPQLTLAPSPRLVTGLAGLPRAVVLPHLSALLGQPLWQRPMRQMMAHALNAVPLPADLPRPVIRHLAGQEIVDSGAGGAGITFLVFCGMGHYAGAPVKPLDAALARRGIRAIWLDDRSGLCFARGLASAGGSAAATQAHLVQRLGRAPGHRLFTFGHSLAAIPALAYALHLGAEGALCLGGSMGASSAFRKALNDRRAGDMALAAEAVIGPDVDVATWYARTAHRPRVHLYAAEGQPLDQAHNRMMEGVAGVTVRVAEGHRDHILPAEMMYRGTFDAALDALIYP